MLKYCFLALISGFLLLDSTNSFAAKKHKYQSDFDVSRIEIVRDSFGVPHIYAPTDAEVAYGLAWATAEDDVENSQFMLCAMRGLLGRKMGIDGVKIDYAVQLLGVNEYVAEHYESEVPDDVKRVLEGYVAGVNDYMLAHPERLWFRRMLPVTPQDIVAGHMLAMALMGGIEGTVNSIIDGGIINKLPEELKEGIGSNAFAFNSSKTADGNTYLAVNAHQPVEGLLSWYEAHLCSEEGWNIVGALFQGSPFIYLGTNENLGWAHTTGQLDEQDVFKLHMHKRKNKQYRFDGEWLKLEKSAAKLRVKVGKKKRILIPVRKRYWSSVYGPTLKTKKGTYAVRTPSLLELGPVEQWFRMNKASNFDEFMQAVEIQGLSRQNITYADNKDNIYFLSNGLVPKRNRNYDWEKVLPGDTSSTLWTEYLPVDSLSWFLNPKCGYVFNVNNAGFEATAKEENHKLSDFHPYIGYREEFNNRSLRFYELMEEVYAGKKIDFQDFHDIKFDITWPKRITYKGEFWADGLFALNENDHAEIADAIRHIKNWNRVCDTLNTDATIVVLTIYEILSANGKERNEAAQDAEKAKHFYAKCVKKAQDHLLKHFGRIDMPLGQVQVLEKNGISYPVAGGPDNIRNVRGTFMDDGRIRMRVGDSYVQMVMFTEDGPQISSINAFGASTDPDSPHHTDQMELFVNHKLKPMTLDKEKVYREAVRVYHPGE